MSYHIACTYVAQYPVNGVTVFIPQIGGQAIAQTSKQIVGGVVRW